MPFLKYNPYGPFSYPAAVSHQLPLMNEVPNLVGDPNYCGYNTPPCYLINNNTNALADAPICIQPPPYQDPSLCRDFIAPKLISNCIGTARNFDINLLDPWGMIVADDIIWVANVGTGLVTTYNLAGRPLVPSINVFGTANNIGSPTGIVYNCTNRYLIRNGPLVAPAMIIIATREGTINAYNFNIDANNSLVMVDNCKNNSVYTGLAMFDEFIYAADFYNQVIDVFDSRFNRVVSFPFVDEYSAEPIPADYAPYNIVVVGELLYVMYAKQDPCNNQYVFPGTGNGYISIFTPRGVFIKRYATRGMLNSPWGLCLAPSCFGYPAGSIMVSSTGDGTINIFAPEEIDSTNPRPLSGTAPAINTYTAPAGRFIGKLRDANNNEICLGVLRALVVGPVFQEIIYWTTSFNFLRNAFVGTINGRSCCN